ncbi:MAG: outer membrane beta-barrel protein [Crocinitomicaceae bacterium]|nr:outer membrane beta-barrel protein [Crocinitomicaceae bacterium]
MNQEFKNIDDLFQSAFADDTAEVPAFVKLNIDKKLSTKKNKKGWIWLSSIILLLLVSITIFLNLNTNESNLTETNSDSTNLTSKNLNTENKNTSNYSTATSVQADDDASANQENQTESKDAEQDSDLTENSDSDNSEKVGSEKSEKKSNVIDSKSGSGVNTKKSSGTTLPDPTEAGGESITDNRTSSGNERSMTADDRGINLLLPLTARMFEKQVSGKIVTPKTKSLTLSNPSSALSIFDKNELEAMPFESEKKYNPWMISLTGGVNYSTSKYTFPTSTEKDYYEKSTFATPAFEASADVRYRLSNSLTFGTGLAISKLTENYQFFKETIDIDTTIQWTYQDIYEYDSLLDTTIWVGIDSTSQSFYDTTAIILYDETGTTQATYLHIPFSVGTQIIRNKFRFDFYAVGRFNLLLNGGGGYLQNDVFTSFSKSANQIFKPWSVDLILGTAVHYQLFEKLYLTGTFRFRPAIGDLYQGVNFKRSFQSYHVGVGLSWKL